MPLHLLTNLKYKYITKTLPKRIKTLSKHFKKYYQNKLKFNCVYSQNNLSKIKDESFINLDRYESIGTLWIASYLNAENITIHNFIVLELNKLQKKLETFIGNITNIYRIQAYDPMCGYFCTEFIDFILQGKYLLDDANSFTPNGFRKSI